jgi:hypothetical protein
MVAGRHIAGFSIKVIANVNDQIGKSLCGMLGHLGIRPFVGVIAVLRLFVLFYPTAGVAEDDDAPNVGARQW